ncbi:hypothetical protein CMV_003854 [Castanea mollissima]|uniref:Uncharacterized protein n=1 Tax=Castanea mollissima TaxID=60419 RepID=A0A8J4RTV5_9ROSI|nr:hypothetical protein CMV_003854 [Castanea mollissima]
MALIMGRRSHKLLFAIFTLLLHLKPALGFISKVGDDNLCWEGVQCNNQTSHVLELHLDFYGLRGTQLQSFDPSKFMGNAGLCGPPLVEKCPEDVTSNAGGSKKHQEDRDGGSENSQGDRDEFWKCLYVGTGAITTSLKEISGL